MVYKDFEDLPLRTVFDKVLRHKRFHLGKILKNDEYQRSLASMV